MNDYTPIDCQLYNRYELAILRRQRLRIAWRDDGGQLRLQTLLPVDLVTQSGAEYLLAMGEENCGERENPLRLRLDKIIGAEALATV